MLVHHICVQTDNYEESLRFYRDIIGFELVKESKGFHGRDYNSWLKLREFYIELQTAKKGRDFSDWDKDSKGIVHLCFKCESVEKEYKRIKSLGWNLFKKKNGEEIYFVEGEALCKVKAPEGTEIELRETHIK